MKIDIARQPLVPAFLTLAAYAAAAIARMPAGAAVAATPAEGMVLLPPDVQLAVLQSTRPGLGTAVAILMALFAGMTTGRIALRYNLYRVGTCLPLALYALIAFGTAPQTHYVAASAASALLALSVKNFARSFCNGYGFDGIFRGALYLGALLMLLPQTLPLVALLPLAVIFFRRTFRETVVAVTGLLLVPFALCYANWGAGGALLAPLRHAAETLFAGEPFALLAAGSPRTLAMLGLTALLTLLGAFSFFTDIYALGTRPRFILRFICCVALLCFALLLLPAASDILFALVAVPAALIIPVHFVRVDRRLSLVVYLLAAGLAAVNIALQ